jgi:hypothetical protein
MPLRPWLILTLSAALALLSGCDVCDDYCATECACAGDDSEACTTTCLETMDVYSGDYRTDECASRLESLNDVCEEN